VSGDHCIGNPETPKHDVPFGLSPWSCTAVSWSLGLMPSAGLHGKNTDKGLWT
jgi:hypothetical protein